MLTKLQNFLEKYRLQVGLTLAGLTIIVIVFGAITVFDLGQDKPETKQNNENPIDVDNPLDVLNPDLAVGTNFVTYEDSELPFRFKYPEGWNISVEYSDDRQEYFDQATVTSPAGDFEIYLFSRKTYNPDSEAAKNYVVQPPGGNPFGINTQDYINSDFEIVGSVNGRVLMISSSGAAKTTLEEATEKYKLGATNFPPGEEQFVYELREGRLTNQLGIVRGDDRSEQANELKISYQVINLSPSLAWITYKGILKEVVKSVEPA